VQSNLVGHLNLLEIGRHRGVEHMVYASSSSVYGGNEKLPFSVDDRVDHPLSLYAATKKADELMSETYAHLYRLPLTGLRFFTVYGPWGRPDMMMWIFTRKILAGEPIRCSTTAICTAISPTSTISSPASWRASTTRRPMMARPRPAAASSRTGSTTSATTARNT
jgi:nucleoside-diphosphate-sugar epimerase